MDRPLRALTITALVFIAFQAALVVAPRDSPLAILLNETRGNTVWVALAAGCAATREGLLLACVCAIAFLAAPGDSFRFVLALSLGTVLGAALRLFIRGHREREPVRRAAAE